MNDFDIKTSTPVSQLADSGKAGGFWSWRQDGCTAWYCSTCATIRSDETRLIAVNPLIQDFSDRYTGPILVLEMDWSKRDVVVGAGVTIDWEFYWSVAINLNWEINE
jgi:hypothetical protein